jgi:predicted aspartyl protease
MVQQSGVFWVKGTINGLLPLDFIVDSGAADVTMPTDVVSTLLRSGTLTNRDFIGHVTRVLADGTEVSSTTFRIKSIKIGDTIAYDVVGSISSPKGDLLLGQSFLLHFKHWSIDNTTHELILDE